MQNVPPDISSRCIAPSWFCTLHKSLTGAKFTTSLHNNCKIKTSFYHLSLADLRRRTLPRWEAFFYFFLFFLLVFGRRRMLPDFLVRRVLWAATECVRNFRGSSEHDVMHDEASTWRVGSGFRDKESGCDRLAVALLDSIDLNILETFSAQILNKNLINL